MLERDSTALVIVDVQERFRPAVREFDRVAGNVGILAQAAQVLGLPVIVTEQYPQGLGSTVPEVGEHLGGVQPVEKTVFSAARADGFDLDGRRQALLCGIEAHVCVSQTAHDLIERGTEVHVTQDAVTSRTDENRELGIHKMEAAGSGASRAWRPPCSSCSARPAATSSRPSRR